MAAKFGQPGRLKIGRSGALSTFDATIGLCNSNAWI
jgi:hypothetical protein